MAVTRITSFAAATNALAGTTPTRLFKVRVQLNPAATVTSFLQLFDNAAPTLGTTTPNDVWEVTLPANAAGGIKQTQTFVIPNGGKRYATALSVGCTTTYNGATGATTHAPLSVDLYWETGS